MIRDSTSLTLGIIVLHQGNINSHHINTLIRLRIRNFSSAPVLKDSTLTSTTTVSSTSGYLLRYILHLKFGSAKETAACHEELNNTIHMVDNVSGVFLPSGVADSGISSPGTTNTVSKISLSVGNPTPSDFLSLPSLSGYTDNPCRQREGD